MSAERIDMKIWERFDSIILQQVRRQSLARGPAWSVVWSSVWAPVWTQVGLEVWEPVLGLLTEDRKDK